MTLDDYLSQPGQTASALAAKAGTSGASINRILHGEQRPSAAMVRAIVEATGGAVTADDLIFGAPREKSRVADETVPPAAPIHGVGDAEAGSVALGASGGGEAA